MDEKDIEAIVHFAAESHVDRSISDPSSFVKSNILGTMNILESSIKLEKTPRILYVSTDEVFGSLNFEDAPFDKNSPYRPNSPYAATKAASDLLVRSYFQTYKFPSIITNCSNNYGPRQFPEKLIPHIILNAIAGKELPVYGDGKQIRDWLFVNDHVRALMTVAFSGDIGETYNIGGNNEIQNIDVVKRICELLDDLIPEKLK